MRPLTLAAVIASMALVLALPACGGGGDGEGDGGGAETTTITFASWGGTSQEAQTRAWIEPFMETHPNIKVLQDSPNDYAKLKAMVESGNVTWDVVVVGGDFGLMKSQTDLLEPIDCEIVECENLQPDRLLTTGHRVGQVLLGVVLGYNTEALAGETPEGWADFFDGEKFTQKRALWNWSGSGIIEAALLADGVPASELYPLDVERALTKIESIKDKIVWFDNPAQCAQLLSDGEVAMAMCPNGRIYTAQQDGAPVVIQWNEALLTADYFVIPKGSKHVPEAMELIAYMTSAEHNADYSYELPYGPANVEALDEVDPSKADDLPSSHADASVFLNDEWYADNGPDLDQRFQTWLQGL